MGKCPIHQEVKVWYVSLWFFGFGRLNEISFPTNRYVNKTMQYVSRMSRYAQFTLHVWTCMQGYVSWTMRIYVKLLNLYFLWFKGCGDSWNPILIFILYYKEERIIKNVYC